MFSVMMMPMSPTSPMAMANPASDMMLESTPKAYMRMKHRPTDSGSVTTTESVLRRCSRNSMITAAAMSDSSVSASLSVATVSFTMSVRS